MDLKQQVLAAAASNGINSILFRNALSRKLDLNVTESMCISLLGIKGISTPKELADYTGLTTGSTTALLDRLEKRNIITRKPNPNDRRGVLIEINKNYGENAASLVAGIQKAHKKLISTYSDKELKIIVDFLTRFTNNIVEHTERMEGDL
jgi:DNA-binding MarR family transcriptional regulator